MVFKKAENSAQKIQFLAFLLSICHLNKFLNWFHFPFFLTCHKTYAGLLRLAKGSISFLRGLGL